MKTYLNYKNQIRRFQDVQETVKIVEKIAASNIHFLKEQVKSLEVYTSKIENVLARLSSFYLNQSHPLLKKKKGKKALIFISGKKGLVGGLWHNLINAYLEERQNYQHIIAIGEKGAQYLKEEGIALYKSFFFSSEIPQKENIENITNFTFSEFINGNASAVDILYPHFISLAEQKADFIPFLPFNFTPGNSPNSSNGLPIFEPSKQKFFGRLLQKYIGVFFYRIILESKLSEFSARTITAEYAAEKTKKLIQKLKLNYFKERRANITKKQLESFIVNKIL